ncbi:D-alanyl-D-alanine carboxypeptidase (penicillin-binding protein 5/6) [Paenibacillus taihuensis]|uniref:serine-type D-Ala-D-Ala carboxypeptidase n=1 Tax=Paenibacillus taihuensis TaxID=1156355 RepID=A0A3D9RWH9_9BACL|nr:D-alanyl-D-alanine carboxypeptidase family protein [Paenibacillus taihuensis]REE83828.1 D-alanyl-D-alanine carboxypeptidase (penicillin-binding protein 5/6) [Paenibacillus taihuensis]
MLKRNKGLVRFVPTICAAVIATMLTTTIGTHQVHADASEFTSNSLGIEARSAILIDADTGQVLYSVNAEKAYPPASMTKLMTEYLVLEEVTAGRLKMTDMVTATKEAASIPPDGSAIYLAEGDKHSVKDLYMAMAVQSANDATIALADHISGTEQSFVEKMNATAKELGLTSAHFTSATGLAETTVISAGDMAKFASVLIKKHPEFLEFASTPSYKFRERDKDPMINLNWMLETNKSIPSLKKYAYTGVDGMKTGYIGAAGYCFTGTAKQGDLRLISVVMDTSSKSSRFIQTAKLFDYGFQNFEKKTVVAPKTVVESAKTVKIKKGKSKEVPIMTATDVTFLVKKGAAPDVQLTKVDVKKEGELVAPIASGTEVGSATYSYKDPETGKAIEKTVKLITSEDVKKASWWRLMFRSLGGFISGLFHGLMDLF